MASPTRLPSLRRPNPRSRPVSMIEGALNNVPDLSADPLDTSKTSNKRDLLYQFSRKAPAAANEPPGTSQAENRSEEVSRQSEETRSSNDSARRRALDEERIDAAATITSKLARPVSMIPPRASSNKTSKTRSHVSTDTKPALENVDAARAQSLAALQGTSFSPDFQVPALEPALQRSGSTRLPQAPRAGGLAIPSRTTSARLKDGEARKPSTTKGIHTTSVITITEDIPSTRRRHKTVDTSPQLETSNIVPQKPSQHSRNITQPSPIGQAPKTVSPPRTSVLSRPRPTSQLIPPSGKPNFNTYQQHYSPAKSALPKPPVPATKHTSKPSISSEPEGAVDFEVVKQQIELLQLSLLYQSSAKSMDEYTASAKRKLSKMHSKLRKEYEVLRAKELVHQRNSNLSAMDDWCSDTGLLVENLQILSLVYSDLTSLMEEGSRYNDVVSMFELWMNETEISDSPGSIQPLPDDWKAAQSSLSLKLRSIQRNLRVLPPVKAGDGSSGVEIVLKACKTLVEDMLKELEVMGKLEKEMMARENLKVEDEVNDLLMSDVGMEESWIPPWQKVL